MFSGALDLSQYLYPEISQGNSPSYVPQVDWNNPIAIGLVESVHPLSASGLVSGKKLQLDSSVEYGVGQLSRHLAFNGSSTGLTIPSSLSGPYTIFAVVETNTTTGVRNICSLGNGTQYAIQLRMNGTSWEFYQFSGADKSAIELSAVVANKPVIIAASWDGVSTISLYRNGVLTGVNTGVTSAMRAVSSWRIGEDNFGAKQAWSGAIYAISYFKRRLTPVEIKNLAENHAQIFAPQSGPIWFAPASADVSTGLSGSSQTASYGAVAPAAAVSISGQTITAYSGAIASIEYLAQLTGLNSMTVASALAPAVAAAIAGNSVSTAGGSVTFSQALELALSGLQSASAQGGIAPGAQKDLPGSEIVLSAGTVESSQAILQALTGISATATPGEIIAALRTAVSGIQSTLSAGTVSPLTGIIAEITGLEVSAVNGTLTAAVTQILSGQATSLSEGTPTAGASFGLTGEAISTSITPVGVEVAIGQTGAILTLQNGVVTVLNSDVTLGLTGSQAALQYGLFSKDIQLALFGQGLAISGGQLVSIIEALDLGQSITLAQGTAAITVERSLSGIASISGSGTVVFTDNNRRVALDGRSILTSAGRVFIKGGALGSSSITILQV